MIQLPAPHTQKDYDENVFLLTKKIAMTMASYLAITSAVFAYPEKDYTPRLFLLRLLKLAIKTLMGLELEEKNIGSHPF